MKLDWSKMSEFSNYPEIEQENILFASIKTATERRAKFTAMLPPEMTQREDSIAKKMALENSSNKSKLHKIYLLADEITQVAKPFIACGNGCANCCKMNVMISTVEAERIGNAIGSNPAKITASRRHDQSRFLGVSCTFLKNDSCSIYSDRPLVCRTHVAFDDSAYWCDPSRSTVKGMPMITFGGLQSALHEITAVSNKNVYADIRDFFPASNAP